MFGSQSSLRVASNVLVIILLGGAVAILFDTVLTWFGARPLVSCTVMPLWWAVADPFASLLALAGLVMWVVSRLRNPAGFWLMVAGILLAIGPVLLSDVINPLC